MAFLYEYIPFLIIIEYISICIYYTNRFTLISDRAYKLVIGNVLMTEVIYYLYMKYIAVEYQDLKTNIVNFIILPVVLDTYFYLIHRLAHAKFYYIHKDHHEYYNTICSWHLSHLDHLITNIGCMTLPLLLFPLDKAFSNIAIMFIMWNSMQAHSDVGGSHWIHHRDLNRRYGSFMDKFFGTM